MSRPSKRRSEQLDNDDGDDGPSSARPAQPQATVLSSAAPSPSPSASFSSDKENRAAASHQAKPAEPRLTQSIFASALASRNDGSASANKRRRLDRETTTERTVSAIRAAMQEDPGEDNDDDEDIAANYQTYYDPEQPLEQRRVLRRGFRDLARHLTDNRAEYLTAESDGLHKTIMRANELFADVRQTSDAILDSRLLVQVGDMSARRAQQTKLGASDAGVDVDDFLTKCVAFMRRGPEERDAHLLSAASQAAPAAPPSQRGGRRRAAGRCAAAGSASDGEEATEADGLNWEWLGVKACHPHNIRPPVPGFLLGPLSLRRKRRAVTQRTARTQRRDVAEATVPEHIRAHEIERMENSNLKQLCQAIHDLLKSETDRRETAFLAELDAREEARGDDLEEAERYALMDAHGITDRGGLCLFHFAFNPRSFGQTVENLFYISFLIRDGAAGLTYDRNGLPNILRGVYRSKNDARGTMEKHQTVFHLDFDNWRAVIDAFEIEKCIIPHREETLKDLGPRGWYA